MNIKWLLFSFYFLSLQVYAGIMPSQSRVIYHAGDKDQSLMLVNTNDYPVIVQNWVDNGEGTPDAKDIPFVSIPPVFRLEKSDVRGIRIIYNNTSLPQDRESLYWLNIYEIPPEKKDINPENSILVTMNTQIKVLFRPEGVTQKPEEAIKLVTCKRQMPSVIKCNNPSTIHLSVVGMKIHAESGKIQSITGSDFMLPPKSEKTFSFNESIEKSTKIDMVYLNDTGETITYEINKID
ncbi:molecular chaperone [Klebsiella sp. BIGb0407]|uniref:fimbrial biogenesis chaperone n=1 Tax=Klebsiella sp. BIGb0407 TaxID=2940603 RepID=UPI00216A4BA1|nr:molecular chaperone [Klebsiella sp. BIGb0407]MCS3429828.1 P pilus assembly chaperone PapD [Klebsiella sp. BIGb0407]